MDPITIAAVIEVAPYIGAAAIAVATADYFLIGYYFRTNLEAP